MIGPYQEENRYPLSVTVCSKCISNGYPFDINNIHRVHPMVSPGCPCVYWGPKVKFYNMSKVVLSAKNLNAFGRIRYTQNFLYVI